MSKFAAAHTTRRDRPPWRACRSALIAIATVAVCTGAAQEGAGDAAQRGQELARRVAQAQDTSGFQIRARVVIGTDADDAPRPAVLQLRIVGRREAGLTKILYQVLWPNTLKGHAAVIERRKSPPVTGFLFDLPARVTPLTAALIAAPFAGSGLTLEDLADDFWRWPVQRAVGQGQAGRQTCTILESHPSEDAASAYAQVRSCVDARKATPLWVEKRGADGALIKRIAFERPESKDRERPYRLAMVVEGGLASPPTRVEFLKSERDLTISPAEFSVERLGALGR
jgi:hypothetical protein